MFLSACITCAKNRTILCIKNITYIKINHKNQKSSLEGIWAAGDCTDVLYHQNNIAAGDAVKALEDIYLELQRIE